MSARGGWLSWLLQRASGALILIFLGLHWWTSHHTGYVDSEHVLSRLQGNVGMLVVDMCLVVLVGYHGFNGIRHIVLDYRPSDRAVGAMNVAITAVFGVFVGLCWSHLYAFFTA